MESMSFQDPVMVQGDPAVPVAWPEPLLLPYSQGDHLSQFAQDEGFRGHGRGSGLKLGESWVNQNDLVILHPALLVSFSVSEGVLWPT